MKRYSFLSLMLSSAILAFVACTDKQPQTQEQSTRVFYDFSNTDSLEINRLADDYVACFNSSNFSACADFLYTVRNDSVFPLDEKQRSEFIASMEHIPFGGCERQDLSLKTERDNQVRITVYLAEVDSLHPDAERPSVNFCLNPVKVEGKWYLTLYDPMAEGVGVY